MSIKHYSTQFAQFFFGIIFSFFPESFIFFIAVYFLSKLLRNNFKKNGALTLCYFLIFVMKIPLFFGDSISNNLLIFLYIILVIFLIDENREIVQINYYSLSLALLVTLSITLLVNLGYVSQQTWNSEPLLVIIEHKKEVFEIIPTHINDAIAYINLGYKGSGKILYELEIRADKEFDINMSLITSTRVNKICKIKTVWSKCSIEMDIVSRIFTIFSVGGFGTWKKNDPKIQIRNLHFYELTSPSFLERINYLQFIRAQGFTFNSNAFGAQIAVVGLLGVIISSKYWMIILTIFPSVFTIFLSGSRGALAAFAVGLLVLFIARSRFYKSLPFVVLICFAGIAFLQFRTIRATPTSVPIVTQQSSIRSLNIADKDSARTRLEIWRLAIKSWLENPRTFLIGTGDLTAAMKVKLDARATSYGLTKDTLTHAHNLWLQTAGESGLLGLLAMMWLWGWVIWKAWKARDAGALALLAAIFVINSVDYLFYYAPVHLAFWMAAAGFTKPPDQPLPSSSHSSPVLQ